MNAITGQGSLPLSLGMRVGAAVLSEIVTSSAIDRLSHRGNNLRHRLNSLAQKAGIAAQFTGFGSILAIHFLLGSLRNARDASASDPRLRELFYLHMLEEGIWIARRGMMSLSLVHSDQQLEQIALAVESFTDRWGRVLPKRI